MRSLLAFVIVAVAVAEASAQSPSLWNHNGSIVTLYSNGSAREFRYLQPRPGLPVAPGEVLFEGSRQGSSYYGTAYVFSSSCGPAGYAVSGPVSADSLHVTLYGQAPVRNDYCQIVSYRNDVLVFDYVAAGGGAGLPK